VYQNRSSYLPPSSTTGVMRIVPNSRPRNARVINARVVKGNALRGQLLRQRNAHVGINLFQSAAKRVNSFSRDTARGLRRSLPAGSVCCVRMNSPLHRRVAAWASQRCRAGRSCPLRTRPFQSWRRAMSDFSATSSTTDSCKRPRRPCRLRAAICSAKRIASSLPEPYRDSRLVPSLSRSLGPFVNPREDTLSIIAKERSSTEIVQSRSALGR